MGDHLTKHERKIVDCWNRLNGPSVSTGRLLAMVEDETGADAGEICDAMIKAGQFKPAGGGHD